MPSLSTQNLSQEEALQLWKELDIDYDMLRIELREISDLEEKKRAKAVIASVRRISLSHLFSASKNSEPCAKSFALSSNGSSRM